MSFEPIVVDMEIEEIPEVVDMELAEEINVTVIQGTDVSDTTAVESDVKTGKVFYKASGDRAVGTHVDGKYVGGTVAWNQLAAIPSSDKSKTQNGVTITDNRDGSFTVSTDANGATANTYLVTGSLPVIKDHKYFFKSAPIGGSVSTFYAYMTASGVVEGRTDLGNGCLQKCLSNGTASVVGVYVASGAIISTPIKFVPQIFDLTQKFGSTIADYAYTLERGTAGEGVAWLKANGFFKKEYYEYQSVKLKSVETFAHPLKDGNDKIIGYFPMNFDLELRGILSLDANNNLQYDGDEYDGNGTVTRKYGIVDLGTINWTLNSSYTHNTFYSDYLKNNNLVYTTIVSVATAICSKYVQLIGNVNAATVGNNTTDKVFCIASSGAIGRIAFADDSYSDAAAFKTAMSGVYLVYKLATPTMETAFDAYPMTVTQGVEV